MDISSTRKDKEKQEKNAMIAMDARKNGENERNETTAAEKNNIRETGK